MQPSYYIACFVDSGRFVRISDTEEPYPPDSDDEMLFTSRAAALAGCCAAGRAWDGARLDIPVMAILGIDMNSIQFTTAFLYEGGLIDMDSLMWDMEPMQSAPQSVQDLCRDTGPEEVHKLLKVLIKG
jgi:hypothetical protein